MTILPWKFDVVSLLSLGRKLLSSAVAGNHCSTSNLLTVHIPQFASSPSRVSNILSISNKKTRDHRSFESKKRSNNAFIIRHAKLLFWR
jgi:hypothetical protein